VSYIGLGPDYPDSNWDAAIKLGVSDLASYEGEGFQLTAIRFIPTYSVVSGADYSLRIWTGNDADLGPTGDPLIDIPVTDPLTYFEWNEFPITPLAITGTQPLWIGLNIQDPGDYPFGGTEGPRVPGKGLLGSFLGNPWQDITGIDANWAIEAYAETVTGRGEWITLTPTVSEIEQTREINLRDIPQAVSVDAEVSGIRSTRALRGYNVYRNGVMIADADEVITPGYTDLDLPDGTYSYYVEAVFYSQVSMPSNTEVVEILIPPPFELPFEEDWVSGDFETNNWYHEGNWQMNSTTGNPGPSAEFYWSPSATDYSHVLSSWEIDAGENPVVTAQFDIYLSNFSMDTVEAMSFEVHDGTQWQTIETWDNQAGSISWTTMSYDISDYAAGRNIFRIRFRAHGENSYNINQWHVDNIGVFAGVTALDPPANVTATIVGTNVVLSWDAVENASSYYIYSSDDPFAADWGIPIAHVGLEEFSEPVNSRMFYRVVASTEQPGAALLGLPPSNIPQRIRR
jgi:hypothetical protein